jgi:putative ABC transport system substrate-binding protein
MKRREFIGLVAGSAVTWPLEARSRQAMPVIGFLASLSSAQVTHFTPAFRAGLRETGQNVLIEFRSAEGRYDRLPALAPNLSNAKCLILATGGSEPAKIAEGGDSHDPDCLHKRRRPQS